MQIVKSLDYSYDKKSFSDIKGELDYVLYYSTRGFINFFTHERLMNLDSTLKEIFDNIVHPHFESVHDGIYSHEKTNAFDLDTALRESVKHLNDELTKIQEIYYYPTVKTFFLRLSNKETLSKNDFNVHQETIKALVEIFSDFDKVKEMLLEQRPEIEPEFYLNNNFIELMNFDKSILSDKFYLVTFLYMKDAVKKGRCFDITELKVDYFDYFDISNFIKSDIDKKIDVIFYLKSDNRQNIPLYLKEVNGHKGFYSEASDKLIFESKEKAIAFLQKMQAGNLEYLSFS